MKVDPARLAAYDVLVAVREQDSYANLALPALLRERGIEGRDAAFTTELVGGTLRGLGAYDAVLDHLATRRPDPGVRDALRLGAHQLLAMRVPDHAAVASTVELVRTRVGHKPAGFTNAVMRRMAAHDLAGWMEVLDAPLAVRFSHPAWIVDALAEALDRPDGARGAARRGQRAAPGDARGAAGVVDRGGARCARRPERGFDRLNHRETARQPLAPRCRAGVG